MFITIIIYGETIERFFDSCSWSTYHVLVHQNVISIFIFFFFIRFSSGPTHDFVCFFFFLALKRTRAVKSTSTCITREPFSTQNYPFHNIIFHGFHSRTTRGLATRCSPHSRNVRKIDIDETIVGRPRLSHARQTTALSLTIIITVYVFKWNVRNGSHNECHGFRFGKTTD